MKTLILFLLYTITAFASDPYEKQLQRVRNQMSEFQIQYNVLGNPFQVGEPIPNFPVDSGDVFLKYRDLVFQIKANPLNSSGDIVEYNDRIRGLIAAGNGMMLRLMQSIKFASDEGMNGEEAEKQQKILDELKSKTDIVSNKDSDPRSALIDNFELASIIFTQNNSFKLAEASSTFQLIQAIFMEVIYQQNLITWYEYDSLIEKRKALEKALKKNFVLTQMEKNVVLEQVNLVINQAKKRIIDRRITQRVDFETQATALAKQNQNKALDLLLLRNGHSDVFGDLYAKKRCSLFQQGARKTYCKNLRALREATEKSARGELEFIGTTESELPKGF